MSKYAFKDIQRKFKIYAIQAIHHDIDTHYYCPNPFCTAHLYLCSVDGLTAPYFRATRKEFPHSKDCFYRKNIDINTDSLKESNFDFDDIVNNLLQTSLKVGSSTVNKKEFDGGANTSENRIERIKTLRQLYLFLKSKDVREIYNNSTIGFMLLDNRSLSMNTKGVFGNKLIEAKVSNGRFYDKDNLVISFQMINSSDYTFLLKFNNETFFKEIIQTVYNNREEIFILVGNWAKESFNCFYSNCTSKKQIYILK